MITFSIDGVTYEWPEENEPEFTWAQPTDDTILAIAAALATRVRTSTDQTIAGNKTFTGSTVMAALLATNVTVTSIISALFKTATSTPATSGLIRLAKTDNISWRDNGDGSDLPLAINGSDQLTFNGSILGTKDVAHVGLYGSPAGTTAGNPIIFPSKINEVGGTLYNTTTGIFTPLVDGYYSFEGVINSAFGNDYFRLDINSSGSQDYYICGASSSSGLAIISFTIHLTAGQPVFIFQDTSAVSYSVSSMRITLVTQ